MRKTETARFSAFCMTPHNSDKETMMKASVLLLLLLGGWANAAEKNLREGSSDTKERDLQLLSSSTPFQFPTAGSFPGEPTEPTTPTSGYGGFGPDSPLGVEPEDPSSTSCPESSTAVLCATLDIPVAPVLCGPNQCEYDSACAAFGSGVGDCVLKPAGDPTTAPVASPTTSPVVAPTLDPTTRPSSTVPTFAPTGSPLAPTGSPIVGMTLVPTFGPTLAPTPVPTLAPTLGPTPVPTLGPTSAPTNAPTLGPTFAPTFAPTNAPTFAPTFGPTLPPTSAPVADTTSVVTTDNTSIASFIATNPDLTQLNRAVQRAGFVEPLSNEAASFTLFAGSDAGFALIPDIFQQILFENDAFLPHLQNLILYSLLDGEFLAGSFTAGPVTAVNREVANISVNPLQVNGLEVIGSDNVAGNGVVQIIGDVLTPSWVPRSLAVRIADDPDLSILSEFVVLSGLDVDLLGVIGSELTLFAPVNAAFEALGADFLAGLRLAENLEFLRGFLAYHVGVGILISPALFPRRIDTFQGGFVTVSTNNALRINQARVTTVDTLANNGVLHKVDAVLDFGQGVGGDSLLDFVAEDSDLSLLFALLQRSGFSVPLSQDNTFTLFAPTNAAFQALPPLFIEILFRNNEFIIHLQSLLLFHLLPVEIFEAGFVNEGELTTFNSEPLVSFTNPLVINDIPVAVADIDVTNGVAHKIGGVLAPSWVRNSLTTRVESAAVLSILGELLTIADFRDALNAPATITLLTPTNDAWNALGDARLAELRNDAAQLVPILAYHVIAPIFTAVEFAVNLELPTQQGGVVTITSIDAGNGIVGLNEGGSSPAGVVAFDILAFNGVLQVIDTVLDPADSSPA